MVRIELVDGEVVPTVNACATIDLHEPFDAGAWPIDAPILYVQGDQDPATTIDGARAHFQAQVETARTFVTVPGVGHNPMSWRIAGGCGSDVWAAILADDDLELALANCGVEATIEHASPGE